MSDLVAFLRARLDEDEQAARQCHGQRWDFTGAGSREVRIREDDGNLGRVVAYCRDGGDATEEFSRAIHIQHFDPARVLREVEAKRRILARYDECVKIANEDRFSHPESGLAEAAYELFTYTLPALCAVYSDHPDYDPAWA